MNMSSISNTTPAFNGKIRIFGELEKDPKINGKDLGITTLDEKEGFYDLDTDNITEISDASKTIYLDGNSRYGFCQGYASLCWDVPNLKTDYKDVLRAYTAAASSNAIVEVTQRNNN